MYCSEAYNSIGTIYGDIISSGDQYLLYKANYVHGLISRCGWQANAKNALFVTLVAGAERFEVYWDQFFADSDVFFRFTSRSVV